MISAAFVYRDTRSQSLAAGLSRLVATLVSLVLCLAYLYLFPASAVGMAILIVIGTLVMTSLDRPDEIGLIALHPTAPFLDRAGNLRRSPARPT